MPSSCAPVGSALPPRRDQVVTAADSTPAPSRSDWGDSINVPRARDRMLDFFEREQLPGDVKSTLAAALNGDLHYQHLLFVAMIDSWPKLQANIGEIARLASIAPWKVIPFALRGQDPTPKAEKLAKDVEEIIWRMKPDVKRGEHDLEGLIASFATAYYMGHGVEETRWIQAKDGSWKIKGTKPLPARYYGYPYDPTTPDDGEDRLMLDPEGSMGARNFVDFPDHRFLIAINKGHPGHPATAAPLRALAAYWLAAVYGLKWFMNFTQLYGIPWRHAEVADAKDDNAVGTMLAEIGSRGYIITRPGTKINILESSKGGNQLPQEDLVKLADDQCDKFILGQTLTSGTDDSGSRALGEVHEGTKEGRVDAVTDFVGRILTHQLLPAIVAVNWGADREDIPEMWAKREEVRDEKALAERDEKLGITDGSTPVTKSWFYERHGLPIPAEGEELLFQPAPDGAQGDPATGDIVPFETEGGLESDWLDEDESDDDDEEVAASALVTAKGAMRMPKAAKAKLKKSKKLAIGSSSVPTGSGASYDPNQIRIPKGQMHAGRWTDGGLVSKGQRARKGVMRPANAEDRKKFGIAPGFKDAKVTDDPKADLVATAINAKGKPVSFYSQGYTKKQEAAKFGRITALNSRMPGLQKQIGTDAANGDHQALTMRMVSLTGMRNGGSAGGGKVATFGASNLLTSQAKVKGDTVTLDFVGKKGVRQLQSFKDPLLAKHISGRIASGEKTVFDGNSAKTLGYLKKISNNDFKVHDFRTWNATVMADKTIQRIAKKSELPTNEVEFKSFQTRVARVVSRRLGNDPAMALKAYIHPAVFNGY